MAKSIFFRSKGSANRISVRSTIEIMRRPVHVLIRYPLVIPDADSSLVEDDAYSRFFASERAFKAPILQGRGGIIADDGRPCLEGNRRTRRQILAGAR